MVRVFALSHINRIMKKFATQKLSLLDERLLKGIYVNEKEDHDVDVDDFTKEIDLNVHKTRKTMKAYWAKNQKETETVLTDYNYTDTM